MYTPAEVEKGWRSKEIEVSQPGFHTKKITWKPRERGRYVHIRLDPLISTITVEVEPEDAVIEYNGTEYGSGELIELKYQSVMIFSVSKEGFKTQTVQIKPADVREVYSVVLERDFGSDEKKARVEKFGKDLQKAVAKRDDKALVYLIVPFRKDSFRLEKKSASFLEWEEAAEIMSGKKETERNLKYKELNRVAWDFYQENDWESLKFLLKHKVVGYNIPYVSSYDFPYSQEIRSYLRKAIEADDADLLAELIRAGAEINASKDSEGQDSDILIAVENKSYGALKELLRLGGDPNFPKKRIPSISFVLQEYMIAYPLLAAVRMNDQQSITLLLKYGASTSVRDEIVERETNQEGYIIVKKKESKLIDNNGKWDIVEGDPVEVKQ